MSLQADLSGILDGERVLTRLIDRIAYANDASVYRRVPAAVVLPQSVDEIRGLFRFSQARRIPLTFRAAGTSLSGQAVTDGILVVVSRHWRDVRVEDEGRRVRVQPGVIGGLVNRHLQPYGTKLGPDPASIQSCMMGGILANNSSGMCCGVVDNAYHTLEAIRFVLPSGVVVDSALGDADARLEREAPELVCGLLELKRRIEGSADLCARIRAKYRLKNTMGYSINAFLDYARPVELLGHLMIGSEGTLGFIAEAVLRTVPDHPLKSTGLLLFPDVPSACASIAALRDSGARALELMDRASLRAIENQPGVPPDLRALPAGAAAILTEYQCATEDELAERRADCARVLPSLPLGSRPEFTEDPDRQAALWRVRKGLIPSVGALRRRGTSFIIEDVVFPPERLAQGVTELQSLFEEHGYADAIVFGHAKDGNLHFVLTQAFQDPQDVRRYDAFMQALAVLVVARHDGALKAEHGTGRNMAPFVAAEWGEEAYRIMCALKRLLDPDGLLNPGVVINDDPQAHVSGLKSLPEVEPEVDACIECGFCERMCPSRDLTLTPRQRIVVRREIARLERSGNASALDELRRDEVYASVATCATDGLCATACPVGIDTGQLVKRLRRESRSALGQELAVLAESHLALVEGALRGALGAVHLVRRALGARTLEALGRRIPGLPSCPTDLPRPAPAHGNGGGRGGADAVCFPSCVSRVAAPSHVGSGAALSDTLVAVCSRAGLRLWIPEAVPGHCCGMPFSSKGYDRAHAAAVNRTIAALWEWSGEGRLEVVVDSSPCAFGLKDCREDLTPANRVRQRKLKILDGIEYAHQHVVPRLAPRRKARDVVLHPVCSVRRMGLESCLESVASAYAEHVEVPLQAGCCGFAGDRGFVVPALTSAALGPEAAEVVSRPRDGHYSSSLTCEIGLARATGQAYRSFWHLLDETTRG